MAGFGDVKQSDKLFDELARQLGIDKEALINYPNLSQLLGQIPEKHFRESDPKLEKVYGEVYKQSDEYLNDDPNAVNIPVDDKIYALKRIAENLAAGAYNKDIIQAKSAEEFAKKIAEKKNLSDIKFNITDKPHPTLPILGQFLPKNKEIYTYVKEPGTILHEAGHAIKEKEGERQSSGEYPQTVFPAIMKPEAKAEALQKILEEGQGRQLAERLSKGHFGNDTLQYAVEEPFKDYDKELEARGFERIYPEQNPRFENLKNLIKTLRNLKK